MNLFMKYTLFFLMLLIHFPSDCFCQSVKRIAFVKQVVYPGLYCASTDSSKRDIIFSSLTFSGPVALFSELGADLYIVDEEDDVECRIWKERIDYCKQGTLETYESLKHTITRLGKLGGHIHPQGYYSRKCETIDFSLYDIVISMDISVPARITQKYPQVLWCYYIGEGCQPSYNASFTKPIKGYDVFLTQDYFENRKLKDHVIEFPYQLLKYGCFDQFFENTVDQKLRSGINLEIHTSTTLTDQQKDLLKGITTLTRSGGTLETMIKGLSKTKYFVQYLDRHSGQRSYVRGNAIVEAVATGNLVIARREGLSNQDILTPETLVDSFAQLFDRIQYFEAHPDEYYYQLELQRKRLDWLCFKRPIMELFKKHDLKISNRI